MRIVRLLSLVLVAVTAGFLTAPVTAAEPPQRLPAQITDTAGALTDYELDDVQAALQHDLGDPVAHLSCSDDEHFFNFHLHTASKIHNIGFPDFVRSIFLFPSPAENFRGFPHFRHSGNRPGFHATPLFFD